MKVLIVEDEIIPANYLKRILIDNDYEVIDIVTKGAKAISSAKETKPDIILMDVMLKDNISGCDAALEISLENSEIKIIFLTAFSDKEMIDFAVKSNAFGYLLKPYREHEIIATLELARGKSEIETTEDLPNKEEQNNLLTLVDGFHFNLDNQMLYKQKEEIACGPRARKLLMLLCENKNSILPIELLLDSLWDTPKSQQTLRSLIHRIRERTSVNLIKNINKIGYKISLSE